MASSAWEQHSLPTSPRSAPEIQDKCGSRLCCIQPAKAGESKQQAVAPSQGCIASAQPPNTAPLHRHAMHVAWC
jgi:hypothetical protein